MSRWCLDVHLDARYVVPVQGDVLLVAPVEGRHQRAAHVRVGEAEAVAELVRGRHQEARAARRVHCGGRALGRSQTDGHGWNCWGKKSAIITHFRNSTEPEPGIPCPVLVVIKVDISAVHGEECVCQRAAQTVEGVVIPVRPPLKPAGVTVTGCPACS